MLFECVVCGRQHEGDKPLDWDSIAFEVAVVETAALGGPRTTQRMVIFFFCFCCEHVRQRMIAKLRQPSSPSRQTR